MPRIADEFDDGAGSRWPDLTLAGWEETRATVHMWTQIVGKVRLALEPPLNHWWQVTLYVSARGLTTSLMPAPHGGGVEIELDFVAHELVISTTAGARRTIALQPRTVASFYEEMMRVLDEVGVPVTIFARPVEIPIAIPFKQDVEHHDYDADAMHRYWLALVEMDRVFKTFRGRFIGKASPVHFFWGGFDLAATRFSGDPAPPHPGGAPNCPDWVMLEAYSHAVSSCGFWPGGSDEGAFYSYAYPEPEGFRDRAVAPEAAHYDSELGEFLLPYRVVRTAPDPDAMLLEFLQSTYEAAADLAGWDRAALEE